MLNSFIGIKTQAQCEIIEKKSRFICFAYPVFSKEEIGVKLDELKREYSDATHICYAYIVNDNGINEKFSDDGEPSGTAGYPICSVIKKRGLCNVLVAVVRYFGKIKLGAGGLTRTYSTCSGSVLDVAGLHEYSPATKIKVKFFVNDYYKYVDLMNANFVIFKQEEFVGDSCVLCLTAKMEYQDVITERLKAIDGTIKIDYQEFYV